MIHASIALAIFSLVPALASNSNSKRVHPLDNNVDTGTSDKGSKYYRAFSPTFDPLEHVESGAAERIRSALKRLTDAGHKETGVLYPAIALLLEGTDRCLAGDLRRNRRRHELGDLREAAEKRGEKPPSFKTQKEALLYFKPRLASRDFVVRDWAQAELIARGPEMQKTIAEYIHGVLAPPPVLSTPAASGPRAPAPPMAPAFRATGVLPFGVALTHFDFLQQPYRMCDVEGGALRYGREFEAWVEKERRRRPLDDDDFNDDEVRTGLVGVLVSDPNPKRTLELCLSDSGETAAVYFPHLSRAGAFGKPICAVHPPVERSFVKVSRVAPAEIASNLEFLRRTAGKFRGDSPQLASATAQAFDSMVNCIEQTNGKLAGDRPATEADAEGEADCLRDALKAFLGPLVERAYPGSPAVVCDRPVIAKWGAQ